METARGLIIARGPYATLRPVRWLIVLPFERPGLMGLDFADELRALGHEVRTFAYRRDNPLYKNRSTKGAYQRWIRYRLERLCLAWRPSVVLVIKGGPIARADPAREAAARHRLRELLSRQPALDDALRGDRGVRPLLHERALRDAEPRTGRPPER